MRNLYARLNISPDASQSDIEDALKVLPDPALESDAAAALMNPRRRREYDRLNNLLESISILRSELNLNDSDNWHGEDAIEYTRVAKAPRSRYQQLTGKAQEKDKYTRQPARRKSGGKLTLRSFVIAFIALIVIVLGYFLFWPVPIEPVVHVASFNPGMTGPYAPNDKLSGTEHMVPGIGNGPEDVTLGPDGYFYAGLQDGRIIRFRPDGSGEETFVNTGGRPLGMQFDADGNLIVADAFRGLLYISPRGAISVLTDSVNGEKMLFPDDLDIAADGTIWFSDASRRFDQHNWILDFMELQPTGRLLSYDPQTRETVIHLDQLYFANGVALGPDDAYVLVNETIDARITRLWLKGDKAGQSDSFLDRLPAYPDNLSYNGKGVFWVALPSPRNSQVEKLWPHPFQRKVAMRLPASFRAGLIEKSYGWVIGVDTEGNIIHNLHDPSGGYGTITSVNEYDGHLYFGSIAMSSVGRSPAPQ
jgi:sugar lactone lactonase YvrE